MMHNPPLSKEDARWRSRVLPTLSAALYCFCSMAMIYANKAVLGVYEFRFPWTFLLFQNLSAVVMVYGAKKLKIIDYVDFDWKIAIKWAPTNLLFVAMLFTSSKSVSLISVSVLTIFKNLTNVAIYYGDRVLFGHIGSALKLFSLFLQVVGAFFAGYSDLQFNLTGYIWMALNCATTAGYVLYMRTAMKTTKLGEFGMVFYNNFLSLFILAPLSLITEISDVVDYEHFGMWGFRVLLLVAGILGFTLSLSSFWLVKMTSPTTYSVAGALNKIPLAIIGMLIFGDPVTGLGLLSVFLGLGGGVVYAYAKYKESVDKEKQDEKEKLEGEEVPLTAVSISADADSEDKRD